MKIIVINGAAQSGKDCFVTACRELIGDRCLNVSSIDYVKTVARFTGWSGEKTLENRKFLSDLKDLLSTAPWGDLPYNDICDRIRIYQDLMADKIDKCIVFIHVREPRMIDKFVKNIGAETLVIRRIEAEDRPTSNHADAEILNYDYNYEIDNNGTIGDLSLKAGEFLEQIGVL